MLSGPTARHQPPVATTRLDDNSDSIVVVQRHSSVPGGSISSTGRQGSAPDKLGCDEVKAGENDETPDELAMALHDLAKITQGLDEKFFPQGTQK